MDIFPCEIWEEVVRKLPAFDLINFCKSSDALLYLLRDKNVVIDFDLGGCFDIYKEELYQNFYQDVGYEHIRSLNINKIYWIGLEEIRDIVRLLPHLEELRALDTILGMRNDDVVLYKKLKKLAISVEMDQFTSTREVYRECFSHLKSLCIKFVSKYRADFRRVYYMFFNELRKLDELWIYDADDLETQMLRYDYIVCNLRSLRKLVIKSKTNLMLLDYTPFGLLKIYERRRRNNSTICYVKFDIPQLITLRKRSLSEVFESRTEKSWSIIRSFLIETPCSFETAQDIRKIKTIKNVEFRELSFFHSRTCNSTFINSVIDILLSKCSKSLKKLCLTFCILQEGNVEQTEKQNVFRHIINNCRYLTDLEIVSCTNMEPVDLNEECVKVPCYSSAIIGAYELISNLRHLKRLRLEVPSYLNGNFLKDVFLKCSELQSLQILSEDTNEDLNSVLYSHLNYAHKLKEFRFENVHIDLGRLFSALNKVIPSKLQRIVVKCDYEHSMQLWPLEKLLKRNCDIIFLAILVSKYNRHQINKLQELLNDFKDHPAKVYVAKTTMTPEEDLVIPEAHKDILYFSTDVSVLHFSDF
uniref:F-box/LRR-repeat protein 18 LRR domain-containing protein n=1 Tax=Dendroctonus ponderosae TaxID=77166 RepID=A0AAR5P7U4_DENPD